MGSRGWGAERTKRKPGWDSKGLNTCKLRSREQPKSAPQRGLSKAEPLWRREGLPVLRVGKEGHPVRNRNGLTECQAKRYREGQVLETAAKPAPWRTSLHNGEGKANMCRKES